MTGPRPSARLSARLSAVGVGVGWRPGQSLLGGDVAWASADVADVDRASVSDRLRSAASVDVDIASMRIITNQLLCNETTRSAIRASTMSWNVRVTRTTVEVARWKS